MDLGQAKWCPCFLIHCMKNWCFWTVVLEKSLESPLDCKEIQPVHSEGHQPWDFLGRNDTKAETPVLWPPHAKSWLIGKDPDRGKDWGQEEKGTTEDEMAGWHHWLDGHESAWTPGVGDGQGGLACCDSWGCKESDRTERLNWTEEEYILQNFQSFFHYRGFLISALSIFPYWEVASSQQRSHRYWLSHPLEQALQPLTLLPTFKNEDNPDSYFTWVMKVHEMMVLKHLGRRPHQWLKTRATASLRILATPRYVFNCHGPREPLSGSWWVETTDTTQQSAMNRTAPPTKADPGPDLRTDSKVERPWSTHEKNTQ